MSFGRKNVFSSFQLIAEFGTSSETVELTSTLYFWKEILEHGEKEMRLTPLIDFFSFFQA